MGPLLHKLWNDPDYFYKSCLGAVAFLVVLLPVLPLGELGALGWWVNKFGLPVLIALAARSGKSSSGLTAEEAEQFRALIATQKGQSA